ncbi:MAG: hypothetical protein QOF38_3391, partial [Pseudonocardiales bacterium]|nr:hypothetical protein [Pseudonocardiales bacterium]
MGGYDKDAVREVLDKALAENRDSLTAPEGRKVCIAYGIPTPGEGLASTVEQAVTLAKEIGTAPGDPVVMKIVSPDILHKTEAGGVRVGVSGDEAVREAYEGILASANRYNPDAVIEGVQVQQMLTGGQEVIIGATTDPTFGKVVVFGLGGVLVEVLRDVTFRLAPVDAGTARSMLDDIAAAEILRGARGAEAVDADALADVIRRLSDLVTDFPQIREFDLNPVFARPDGASAADVRILLETEEIVEPVRYSKDEILATMNRLMHPRAVAVIGASNEDGKIGNSVMKNLINGGYTGEIYPINPKADQILGRTAYRSIGDV